MSFWQTSKAQTFAFKKFSFLPVRYVLHLIAWLHHMIIIAIQTRPFKSSCASVLVLTFTWMWLRSNSRILRQWNQRGGETAPSADWFVSLFCLWRLCLGTSFTGGHHVNDITKNGFQCNPSLPLHKSTEFLNFTLCFCLSLKSQTVDLHLSQSLNGNLETIFLRLDGLSSSFKCSIFGLDFVATAS